MRSRITAVSFFYRLLKIPEVLVDKMAIIFVWITSSLRNFVKTCKIRFCLHIYKLALLIALF